MLIRCIKLQLLPSTSSFRCFHTSRPSCSSLLDKVRDFFTERENFDVRDVQKAHRKDNVNEKEWTLIYKDTGAARSFYMTAAFLPCFLIGATVFIYDTYTNKPADRLDFVRKLITDAEELGILLLLPSIGLALVIALLIRVQQIRLIRIYQHRKDVDQYMAIRSKYVIALNKHKFRRDISTGFYYADEQTDGIRVALNFLLGNIQVGKSRFMIMDDMFKANNYRSYMLNETSVPPRL